MPAAYTAAMKHPHDGIGLVAFDGDDTLWRSEDYYRDAQVEFERIVGHYVDLADARVGERLYAIEKNNLALFGYGVKGMVLSMLEAAVAITDERIGAADLHRIVVLGKQLLRHPVDLLPGIRAAVEAIAAEHPVVLITKGDLFHQEYEIGQSRSRARRRKRLILQERPRSPRSRKERLCGPVRPNVVFSCHDFAPITEAA